MRMSIRKHPALAFPARHAAFAGARWLGIAHRLANRYRRIRRRTESAMLWRRALARPRRFMQPNLAVLPAQPWRLNMGLNFHFSQSVSTPRPSRVEPSPAALPETAQPQLHSRTFSPTYKSMQAPIWRTSIVNHLTMKRFVTRQAPALLQPMCLLTEHRVHTAPRPVVRERSQAQALPLSRSATAQARGAETVRVEPRIPAVREMPATSSVAQPRMADINIAQITEQVMRQLDHRISAWRERRGRA
jgi:hypothetical protein